MNLEKVYDTLFTFASVYIKSGKIHPTILLLFEGEGESRATLDASNQSQAAIHAMMEMFVQSTDGGLAVFITEGDVTPIDMNGELQPDTTMRVLMFNMMTVDQQVLMMCQIIGRPESPRLEKADFSQRRPVENGSFISPFIGHA
jgi:hypothetical protein